MSQFSHHRTAYKTAIERHSVKRTTGIVRPYRFINPFATKICNFTPRNVHERFQTLLTPVLMIFTDFLSAVVTSEIAQILSLYGGGFLALKWQSGSGFALILV